MDRRTPASSPGSSPEASSADTGVEARRERLQADLLAAAEEEAAAIVEEARREITVTVRRARRDLLLIRAQLQLIGLEPRQIAGTSLEPTALPEVPPPSPPPSLQDEASPDTWPAEVPRDAIIVNRTHALRHAVAEAADELEALPAPVSPRENEDTAVSSIGTRETRPPLFSGVATPWLIGAGVAVLAIGGGILGWKYGGRSEPPAAVTRADNAAPQAPANGESSASRGTAAVASSPAPPVIAENRDVSPSRVVLKTTRPVWMRIDVDGKRDDGRLHQADETTELTPTRSLTIRVGDAGAVLLSTGGGPPAVMGGSGEVLTRQISIPSAAKPPAVQPVAEKPVTPVPPLASPAPGRGTTVASATPAGRGAAPTAPPPAGRGTAPAAGTPARPLGATPAPDQRTQASAPPQSLDAEQQAAIFARHVQWLDAYGRSDQAAMSTLTASGFSLRDERIGRSANAAASTGTPIQVSDVHIDVAGVGAVLTARLRTTVDGVTSESMLSEVWVRGEQQRWSLMGVRITPVDSVPQPAR